MASTGGPSPPVGLGVQGAGSITSVPTVIFVFTLLVTGILVARKVRGGILIGLIAGTIVAVVVEAIWHLGSAQDNPGGWGLSVPTLSGSPFALPDLSLVGEFSLDSFGRIGILAAVMLVFTLVFTNFFDAMGTFTGLSRQAGVADANGNFPRLQSALVVEGAGAVVGGAASASSNTVFIESGAGIGAGARTGLASLVTGGLFLAAMFLTPLAAIVPTEVAAAALVIVGAMMASHLREIDLADFSIALPVVLTVAVMPLSYSIANGIGVGFIAWAVRAYRGRQGPRDQPAAVGGRGGLPAVLRARMDRLHARGVTPVDTSDDEVKPGRRPHIIRLAVLAVFLLGLYYLIGVARILDLEDIRGAVAATGPAAPLVYVLVSAVLGSLFVPGPLLAAGSGLLFGPVLGTFVTLGATVGTATIASLGGRRAGRDSTRALLGAHARGPHRRPDRARRAVGRGGPALRPRHLRCAWRPTRSVRSVSRCGR